MSSISRRTALQLIGLGSTATGLPLNQTHADSSSPLARPENCVDRWHDTLDRVWLGESFWANPMEDWAIVDGAAECQTSGGFRNIQLLTHELTNPTSQLEMSVVITQKEIRKTDGGAGFRLGMRSEIEEYRSNCFAKNGINAGLINGQLALAGKRETFPGLKNPQQVTLTLTGQPVGTQCQLKLTATSADGTQLGQLTQTVAGDQLLGNVALVNNYDRSLKKGAGAKYRFQYWTVAGEAFTVDESRQFGPILWSMYSLSDSRSDEGFVVKLSALTGPLTPAAEHFTETDAPDSISGQTAPPVDVACQPIIELFVERPDGWQSLGKTAPDTDAWTANFRIPNWDESVDTNYKLVYTEQTRSGGVLTAKRTGVIRANPSGRPLRIGAMTCQNDYAFPYEPVANNVLALDPDLVYFSGDQLYENHGGYGLIRDPAKPAILNYLRKFYQFGWAFGELLRSRPAICIADDHDVFQGNIWGEAGKKMEAKKTGASSLGGYREPARMVNVVHRTCTSHHPDLYDPEPVLQGISTYYGDMVYGGVSFAILADRQWKSGPEHVDTGRGRADHVLDPTIDTLSLDEPGLELLGQRQEQFLKAWAADWRGHTMKVLLSQTVFSGLATHHGGYDGYLKADLDSGSWPQTARNRAVAILKTAKPLHINGDQHLTTLSQYGVDSQRDSCWSFCTPAIAVGYPRWWRPDEIEMPHSNRPQHGLPNTGEFVDSFGNKTYVYAVGNPQVGRSPNRYEKAHEKGSGFGFVTIDPAEKTYFIESYRFLIDPTDGNPDNQFPGWPVTIKQQENGGENLLS